MHPNIWLIINNEDVIKYEGMMTIITSSCGQLLLDAYLFPR